MVRCSGMFATESRVVLASLRRTPAIMDSSERMSIDPQPIGTSHPTIQRVLIIGAGWTGRQIAGQMIAHGLDVTLIDSHPVALADSERWINDERQQMIAGGYWPAISQSEVTDRLTLEGSFERLPDDFDFVLETVSELFALKRRLMKQYSERYASPCLMASNSSYFTPSMIQKHVVAPERFANFHFHVPIWKATLVDVAAGEQTSESTLERLASLADRIGQTPLVQRVENPGYVFNWMLRSLFQSSLQLVDRGVAQPDQIDMAWCKVTGMEVGPFGMMDQIGIDLVHQTMSHARFLDGDGIWERLIAIVEPYVEQKQLGVKTGKGFFEYPDREGSTDA